MTCKALKISTYKLQILTQYIWVQYIMYCMVWDFPTLMHHSIVASLPDDFNFEEIIDSDLYTQNYPCACYSKSLLIKKTYYVFHAVHALNKYSPVGPPFLIRDKTHSKYMQWSWNICIFFKNLQISWKKALRLWILETNLSVFNSHDSVIPHYYITILPYDY